jgi:hypothetical protein
MPPIDTSYGSAGYVIWLVKKYRTKLHSSSLSIDRVQLNFVSPVQSLARTIFLEQLLESPYLDIQKVTLPDDSQLLYVREIRPNPNVESVPVIPLWVCEPAVFGPQGVNVSSSPQSSSSSRSHVLPFWLLVNMTTQSLDFFLHSSLLSMDEKIAIRSVVHHAVFNALKKANQLALLIQYDLFFALLFFFCLLISFFSKQSQRYQELSGITHPARV